MAAGRGVVSVRRWGRWARAVAMGAAVAAGALSAGAAPDDGCPREVRDAMRSWGQDGVHRAAAVIRSEDAGIGRPTSVFDFSCLTDLFRAPDLYFFHGGSLVNGLLGGLRDFVCEAGERLFDEHVNRPIGELVFWDEAPHVPGRGAGVRWGETTRAPTVAIRPAEGRGTREGAHRDIRWFRTAIGGTSP